MGHVVQLYRGLPWSGGASPRMPPIPERWPPLHRRTGWTRRFDRDPRTRCRKDRPCRPGCWCPEGLVLNSEQQCVRPRDCPCQVAGVRYWPGQLVKVNCRICTCQEGQMKRCRQNPECTGQPRVGFSPAFTPLVNCGWSAWSPWGECLGPCGVQSIQWSFRSPNNPIKHGNGRQCRGIYRKARRCQTEPCEECEHHGRTHAIGDRWRSGQCQVCQCLPNLTVQCSQYCPYSAVGCPEGWVLVKGRADTCCYCTEGGENQTAVPSTLPLGPLGTTRASSALYPTAPPLSTYPLPPLGDLCYGPLGIASLPDTSFTASAQQPENPAHAARLGRLLPGADLQGWAPPAEVYPELLSRPPFLQVDLREPRNLTGVVIQGAGTSDAYVTSFFLRFSLDGVRWHDYQEVSRSARPEPKRMVHARHVRLLPHDFHNGIFLRLELLGCGKGVPRWKSLARGPQPHSTRRNMEPGWSPLQSDPNPYFQVDFLQPFFITAVAIQGGGGLGGFIVRYRLLYSNDGVHFWNYTTPGHGPVTSLKAQLLEGNSDSSTPRRQELSPTLLARFLRFMPVEYHQSISLRLEVFGCTWKTERAVGRLTSASSSPATGIIRTRPTAAPSPPEKTLGTPTWLPPYTKPVMAAVSRISAAGLTPSRQFQKSSMPAVLSTAMPGLLPTRVPSAGMVRILCTQGQFACETSGCAEAASVCDGQQDCADGSDEAHCGESHAKHRHSFWEEEEEIDKEKIDKEEEEKEKIDKEKEEEEDNEKRQSRKRGRRRLRRGGGDREGGGKGEDREGGGGG
ncbi:hypothetical protein L345_14147, partial [Ophiophagus hannah]